MSTEDVYPEPLDERTIDITAIDDETLDALQGQLEEGLTSINMQLDLAAAQEKAGNPPDLVWAAKARKAKRHKGLLHQKVLREQRNRRMAQQAPMTALYRRLTHLRDGLHQIVQDPAHAAAIAQRTLEEELYL